MIKRIALAASLLAATTSYGLAAGGQYPSGWIQGNAGASAGQASPSAVTAILDRALGSARGSIIERGASGWALIGPGSTAGLPFVSNGSGNDPAYQILGLSGGGTNGALTASNGGIVWSDTSKLNILAGTATARQMLQSGASATPAWSTATWPATTTINQILYSSAGNTVTGLATANGGILNTSSGGAPSITVTPVLGVAGSTVGSIGFQNATSGTETIQPAAGALGSGIATLPAGTYNIVGDGLTQTLTNKTLNCANNTCTVRIGSDVSGLGTGVATGLGSAATGSGGPVLSTSPTITTPAISGDTAVTSNTSTAFTVTGSSTNSIGFHVINTSVPRDWLFFVAGSGGPCGSGFFGIFDNSGGGARLCVSSSDGSAEFKSTTAATSSSTGALRSDGGLGVTGAGWFGTYIAITPTVVNSLPTCNSSLDGARAYVTNNATAVSFGGAVTTGGTTHSPVYCDGSVPAWKQG